MAGIGGRRFDMALPSDQLHGIAFCAGGGGLEIGLRLVLGNGYKGVCYIERDVFAASTLVALMEAGWIHHAPIWSDIKSFRASRWRGTVDIVSGGYPCQPFSLAGKRGGADDPRHLWPYIHRAVRTLEPPLCFFENVSGHLSLGFDKVAQDLEGLGYSVAAGLFRASEVGASHQRERLFILAVRVADATRKGSSSLFTWREEMRTCPDIPTGAPGGDVANHYERERWRLCRCGRTESAQSCDRKAAANQLKSESGYVADASTRGWRTNVGDDTAWQFDVAGIGGEVVYASRLGDSHERGLQGQFSSDESGELASATSRAGLPLFPPGPGDTDAWQRILAIDSGLAPAQPAFRLLADGLAADRSRLLRLAGNGVVPLCAAYAFVSLWACLRGGDG